jgi:osmotically-inducible protein OsmY
MTVAQLTNADRRTREIVLQQLEWDPAIDASLVGVVATNGVIELTGCVDTYAEKLAAERVAKSVRGVRAVANDIDVRPMLDRTDTGIASDVLRALELRGTVPETVQVAVHSRYVTLTGPVDRLFQKMEAEKAARRVKGVRGIFNHIEVASEPRVRDVHQQIVQALHRHADLDARQIFVTVDGDVATLGGTVPSWLQRDIAEKAAADAPGITRVNNGIVVDPPVEPIDDLC